MNLGCNSTITPFNSDTVDSIDAMNSFHRRSTADPVLLNAAF